MEDEPLIFIEVALTKDIPKKGRTCVILSSQSGETKDLHRCIGLLEQVHRNRP